jgi:hypothetical protein
MQVNSAYLVLGVELHVLATQSIPLSRVRELLPEPFC